ncbi:MAG TPA: hypothetical protein VHK47_02940 [Polyangia bacterium]|jgi:hypothetical protein|nr:hypothetical protein [Polyangia bacterium]
MIRRRMQQIPPTPPKKGGRPTPGSPSAALFSTESRHVAGAPEIASRRSERSARIMGDVRRALLFALVLVVVGFVLYEFVSVTAL